MCVIIIKQDGLLLSKEVAKTSGRVNPHGLGIIWLDTFEVTYHKSTEHKILLTDRPFIAHFRYATVGAINKENTHPFQCNAHEWLMMNGTIHGKGNYKESDSKVLARELGQKPRHTWKKELEQYSCRFVTVNTRNRTYQIYNKSLWTIKDGIWYSKANVLEEHLVAVYGTLKKGNGNYYRYLTESKFIGKGETKDKYPLVIKGLPYLLERKGEGHNVEVDVFKVDHDTFEELDILEGHPRWYERVQIPIKMNKGKALNCWVYFNRRETGHGQEFHKSYASQIPTTFKPQALPFPEEQEKSEFYVDDESPVCINCYNDLEYDFFSNYYCKSCGEWFKENEVVKFRQDAI